MVPDYAKAILVVDEDHTNWVQNFEIFTKEEGVKGSYYLENGELVFQVEGVSSHGMEPDNGKNAGLYLAAFLSKLPLSSQGKQFFEFTTKHLFKDSRGIQLGVSYTDDITGDLTINVGKLRYTEAEGGRLGLNMRYPVTFDMEKGKSIIENIEGYSIENFTDSKPHHVSKDDELVQTLKKVYEDQTGERGELLSIGGGTYARSLEAGVAFGALFPGREDIAHQKDEYMYIEDLLKATAIYAQAIYELACES
jgi:succinyl-diaminopimelate desuccinylase